MRGVIDRFEGDIAVIELEGGVMIDLEKNKLPNDASEGDALIIQENSISIDYNETRIRKKNADKLLDDLFE